MCRSPGWSKEKLENYTTTKLVVTQEKEEENLSNSDEPAKTSIAASVYTFGSTVVLYGVDGSTARNRASKPALLGLKPSTGFFSMRDACSCFLT